MILLRYDSQVYFDKIAIMILLSIKTLEDEILMVVVISLIKNQTIFCLNLNNNLLSHNFLEIHKGYSIIKDVRVEWGF